MPRFIMASYAHRHKNLCDGLKVRPPDGERQPAVAPHLGVYTPNADFANIFRFDPCVPTSRERIDLVTDKNGIKISPGDPSRRQADQPPNGPDAAFRPGSAGPQPLENGPRTLNLMPLVTDN